MFASSQKAGELPLRPTAMLEMQIKPAARAAQLGDRIGWHTFRHSYSSMLRQLSVEVKVQQELPRHADIRTMMNIYTWIPEAVASDEAGNKSPGFSLLYPSASGAISLPVGLRVVILDKIPFRRTQARVIVAD